jgi:class 3 adenylate cyclase
VAGVLIHVVAYAVVNALLVFIWLVIGGDENSLETVREDPVQAVRDGFWPGWVIVSWGALLAIHVVSWFLLTITGARRRARKRMARARELAREHRASLRPPPVPPSGPATAAPMPQGRRWVTVMFTDIAGSTALNELLGDEAWSAMVADHRRLVRDTLPRYGGLEVGTQGDGFLVRFDSPTEAVQCAVALQQALTAARDGGTFTPLLRIGIHAGDAVADDGDLLGRVINLAARVVDAADAGQILVTEPVADHVGAEVRFEDCGLRELKGFAQPRHLLAAKWQADDPAEAPTREMTVRRTIAGGAPTDATAEERPTQG